jgi:hypothetical protein
VLGLALFVNWADVAHNPPIHYTDYALHYAGVWSAAQNLAQGRLWGYSPYFHAGYPAGALFEANNKGIELASVALHHLGAPLPHAFNAVVLALMAAAPFSVYVAARLLGIDGTASGLAQALALALWYGDPAVSWTWQGGTLAFGSASACSLVVSAALWRWAGIAGPEQPSRRHAALLFGLGPLLFWIHPYAFFLLLMPMGAAVLLAWGRWPWHRRVVPLFWAGWVMVLSWPWLRLVVRFLPQKTSSAQFLQGGLPQLLEDRPYLGLRLVVLGLAALGLWLWRRAGRMVWLAVSASLVVWLALAYGGVYAGFGDVQPYRFVIPALLLGTIPAAQGACRAWRRSRWVGVLVIALLVAAVAPPLYWGRPRRRLQADGTPRDHLSGPSRDERQVCRGLQGRDLHRGRVLTNDWRLGAYLPSCSGAQVIGGPFLDVWTTYGHANAGMDDVFGVPLADLDLQGLRNHLARYNVRWVVANVEIYPDVYDFAAWRRDHPGLLELIDRHGVFEVCEVRQPGAGSWFLEGTGEVRAEHNRLSVRNASPDGLVLKYHWLDSLRTEPVLQLRPVSVGRDPVPFIGVENGEVTDFDVVQAYD